MSTKAHHTAKAAFHKAMADHHTAMSSAHSTHGAVCKAKADGMADDHADKAMLVGQHGFHKAMSDHHANVAKAHSDMHAHHMAQCDSCEKALTDEITKVVELSKASAGTGTTATPPATGAPATPPAAGTPEAAASGVKGMIDETAGAIVKTALAEVASSPEVKKQIQEMVIGTIRETIGGKMVPDNIRTIFPNAPIADDPASGVMLVPRAGQNKAEENVTKAVDPAFRHLVEI